MNSNPVISVSNTPRGSFVMLNGTLGGLAVAFSMLCNSMYKEGFTPEELESFSMLPVLHPDWFE